VIWSSHWSKEKLPTKRPFKQRIIFGETIDFLRGNILKKEEKIPF